MFDVIYHTALVKKDLSSYQQVLDIDTKTIEVDFVLTKDLVPIWTHSNSINITPIDRINSNDERLKDFLTLEDMIDLTDHKKVLLLDFKYVNKKVLKEQEFSKIIDYLVEQDNIMIQSYNRELIRYLTERKDSEKMIKGLIINYFLTYTYFKNNVGSLKDVDFVSLSSEVWEIDFEKFLNRCDDYFPKAKKYAWTWDAIYNETPKRLGNYIDKDADGIITDKPENVKRIVKQKKPHIIIN